MTDLAPQYIDQRLNMPWPLICQIACQALILGVRFEDIVELALRQRVGRS